MRKSLLSLVLIAGLFLPIGASKAQDTNTVTATCKDGTAFTGTKRSGACRGHGGVQSWGSTRDNNRSCCNTFDAYDSDEPAHRSKPRWRPWAGLGEYRQQGVSLPRRSLVWQDQARQLHVRSRGAGTGRQAGSRKGLYLVGPPHQIEE